MHMKFNGKVNKVMLYIIELQAVVSKDDDSDTRMYMPMIFWESVGYYTVKRMWDDLKQAQYKSGNMVLFACHGWPSSEKSTALVLDNFSWDHREGED